MEFCNTENAIGCRVIKSGYYYHGKRNQLQNDSIWILLPRKARKNHGLYYLFPCLPCFPWLSKSHFWHTLESVHQVVQSL